MATRREAAQSLARTRDLLSVAALNAHQADEVPAVLADDVEARALARGGPAHGGRSAAGRGAGPMKYSVRITRLPIEDEPRKQMEAAGTLPENYARRELGLVRVVAEAGSRS